VLEHKIVACAEVFKNQLTKFAERASDVLKECVTVKSEKQDIAHV